MIKQYLFLKRNRLRKKSKIYKQLIVLTFDFTSLFYALLVIGYMIIAILLEVDSTLLLQTKVIQFEAFTIDQFWVIVTALPLIYLIRAFKQPGVIFSTAEYTLTILPHTVRQVWVVIAAARWLKALIIFSVLGFVVYVFSPTTLPLILTYIGLLFGMNVLMTIMEEKFFQFPLF